ncbi:hypothetical protein BLSMQ_0452 [Brevibacterium aurantiacum]|uniref:Uncharacterized protein n=1 Tax=Brevibacterium aurantiacum TaxID=273384 RepID=A0A1D7VZM3_BREAU|nr:hypothetical protein BLSMQ_0452 [Brevibacterium aurantiacum]
MVGCFRGECSHLQSSLPTPVSTGSGSTVSGGFSLISASSEGSRGVVQLLSRPAAPGQTRSAAQTPRTEALTWEFS